MAAPVLCARPRPRVFLVYLNDEKSGFFSNKDDPISDYFYRTLYSLRQQHMSMTEYDKYQSPFNPQGFTLNQKTSLVCYDKYKKRIPISQVIGKLVKLKVQIIPYEIENNGTIIAGLTIKSSSVVLV